MMRLALAFGLLILALFVSLRLGAVDVSFTSLGDDTEAGRVARAVLGLRAARIATGVLVGAALALCGSVLQRLLRNPLADPFVLGISSGGTAFVVAASVLGLPALPLFGVPLRSAYALLGCGVALAVLLAAWRRLEGSSVLGLTDAADAGLPLMGLVLNAFFGAALMLFVAFASAAELAEAQRWMLGSLQSVALSEIAFLALFALVPAVLLLRARHGLEALVFGDAYAQSIGFPASTLRRRALVATAVLVALVVSVSGSVGFVGLIVPHLARRMSRRQPRGEWLLSMTLGAALVVLADTFSRTVLAPAELPVGVFTACLGAPVLAVVLLNLAGRPASLSGEA
ncbi:MAG: iron ABC transporter permease [Silvanigrellales bacterium]|nr:iron ABC transporter permease [Silvanigrellales bacterium]